MQKKVWIVVLSILTLVVLSVSIMVLKTSTAQSTVVPTVVRNETISVSQTIVGPSAPPMKVTVDISVGTTALELLQKYSITTQGEGEQAFVTSIGSRSADPAKKEYWSFEVNGKPASVGAGSYILRPQDSIVWSLKTY